MDKKIFRNEGDINVNGKKVTLYTVIDKGNKYFGHTFTDKSLRLGLYDLILKNRR